MPLFSLLGQVYRTDQPRGCPAALKRGSPTGRVASVELELTRFREAWQAFNGGFQMPKTRPPHSPEFRRQMVDLVRAGRDPTELAREFEPIPLYETGATSRLQVL